MMGGMSRAQHLQWCKTRAILIINEGKKAEAVASFVSDMHKHPELENHMFLGFMMPEMLAGRDMAEFINGFN